MKIFAARSSRLIRRSMQGRRSHPFLLTPHKRNRLSTNSSSPKKPESSTLKSTESASKKAETKVPAPLEEATAQAEKPKDPAGDLPLTNPFPLLAHATEHHDLASRLRAFSNTFAVIGALWCSLSIGALAQAPIDDIYKDTDRIDNLDPVQPPKSVLAAVRWRKATSRAAVEAQQNQPKNKRRPPVLVKYFGVPEEYLEDIYMACWSASFYTSAIGLALSTVVAGIVASTAPAYVKIFVRRHSDILMALPVCQGLSSGFAGVGLAVGLDEARGEPLSWIGYIGTVAGGLVVGNSTLKVLRGYKASRAAGKLSTPPPKDL